MAEAAPARPGLPLFLGILLVAAVHGPLLKVPPLLEEQALLESPEGVQGWLPGVQFTRGELLALQAPAHRAIGLLLEVLLVVTGTLLLQRHGMALLGAVAMAVVYVLHPAHTETGVLLSSRPLLVSEVLLVAGALGLSSPRGMVRALACASLAAGAAGMPAILALALPFLFAGASHDHGTRRWAVLALWVGFLASMLGRTGAGGIDRGLAGIPVWWQPGTVGLVLSSGPVPWGGLLGFLAMAALLRFLAPATARRAVDLGLLAALLALLAGPVARPARLDLGRVGEELSPDVFLPFLVASLALIHLALRRSPGRRALLPLLLLLNLAPGWWWARQFRSEAGLLQAAVRLHPDSWSVHLARAEHGLRQLPQQPPSLRHETARTTLQDAEQAIRLGADRRGRSARCLALAWLGKLGEAREAWSRLQAETGTTAAILGLRGELELAAEDPWEALRWFREARNLARGPGPARRVEQILEELHGQIEASLRTGTPEEVRGLCDRLLEAAPDDLRAWEARAATYLLEGRHAEAAEAFQAILDFAPVSRVALKGMIQALEAMDRAEEAIPFRRRLLELGGIREFQ